MIESWFGRGSSRARVRVGLALSVLIATPAVLLRASKLQRVEERLEEDKIEAVFLEQAARRMAARPLPAAVLPPVEFAPFGKKLLPRILEGDAARGKLLTPLPPPFFGCPVPGDPRRLDRRVESPGTVCP